jgi:undecaprenyl-phosphate 4-deoxy-4-formamido-L-arabinose transferase
VSDQSVSIVIPVYNELANLDELIERCLAAGRSMKRPFELVLVDDGSRDGSSERLTELAAEHRGEMRVVLLNRNYGQHSAVMCGFAHAAGAVVVTLDADLQNPPEEIPRVVEAIAAGNDVVGAIRTDRRDSLFRRLASFVINHLVKRTTGVMMHDYGCMLRGYRRSVVVAMLQCPERSTFIPVLANSFAKRTAEVEVKHAERSSGKSKYSLFKLINLQFDLLTCMTTTPLRLLTYLGAGVTLLGVGFGAMLLILRLIFGPDWAAQGVFTLFAILFFFVGAQFIALGLMGEYIGRIYLDVRGRPRYFIDRVVGETAVDKTREASESAAGRTETLVPT